MLASFPGAQLTHELNADVGQSDGEQAPPKPGSGPAPAQPASTNVPVKPPTPIAFVAEQSSTHSRPPSGNSNRTSTKYITTAENVPPPVTGKPARTAAASTQRQSENDNALLFGSPFASPIMGFLENAPDGTTFTGPSELNQVVSNRTSFGVSGATTSQPSHPLTMATSTGGNNKSQGQSQIPPLFSETPPVNRVSVHKSSSAPKQTDGVQQHFEINSSTSLPARASQSRPQQIEGRAQLGPRQPPATRPVSYYPQPAAVQGYYGTETSQDWSAGGGNYLRAVSTAATSNIYPQIPPTQGNMGYNSYSFNAVHPYAIAQAGLPPPPGPLQTYGNTAVVAGSSNKQKQPDGSFGVLTFTPTDVVAGIDADVVAGINLKFKHATKRDFSVPKR
jgi:hypothetical protein